MSEHIVRDERFMFYMPNGTRPPYDLTKFGELPTHLDAQGRPVLHLPGGLTIRKGERLGHQKWARVRTVLDAHGAKWEDKGQ